MPCVLAPKYGGHGHAADTVARTSSVHSRLTNVNERMTDADGIAIGVTRNQRSRILVKRPAWRGRPSAQGVRSACNDPPRRSAVLSISLVHRAESSRSRKREKEAIYCWTGRDAVVSGGAWAKRNNADVAKWDSTDSGSQQQARQWLRGPSEWLSKRTKRRNSKSPARPDGCGGRSIERKMTALTLLRLEDPRGERTSSGTLFPA